MSFAAVFPGQGSQSLGMLSALADSYPQVRETFMEASDILGQDLWAIVQNGPIEDLNQTQITQPVMLTAGVAVWRVWDDEGGCRPEMIAGHSLGEYTALVCGGALHFADTVRLVAERGRLMQEAVPQGEGAMAAILGLTGPQIGEICHRITSKKALVEPVNFNTPGQVVIAGHQAAVVLAMGLATDAGAKKVVRLPVSVPSHCALMKPAGDAMRVLLAEVGIKTPAIPVVHNVDAMTHADPGEIREALIAQMDHPVRWVDIIESFADEGTFVVFEFGPGRVLSGLNKRIDRTLKVACIEDPQSLNNALSLCEEFGI